MPSSTAQNSPSSTSAGYKLYVSPKWFYSVEFPATWFDFPVKSTDETNKYFSNENTASFEGLSGDGIVVTFTVDMSSTRPCAPGPGGTDSRISTTQVSIDGQATTEYFYLNGVGVIVMHNNWCYRLTFLTAGTQTRDKHMGEIAYMLNSFRYNR